MTSIRQPQSVAAAETLCQLYAANASVIEDIENRRNAAIALANGAADEEQAPLLEEQAKIEAKLAPWWEKAGADLTNEKRKTIELGGCTIGSRSGRATLAIAGKPADLVELLEPLRWAKALLRVSTSLDRNAALKALDGPHGDKLRQFGLSLDPGRERFVLTRAEQAGTRAKG